jgi:LCP family protein required for cell wall assembly
LDWGADQRLTLLLIGTDAGYGRRGARADSVMVATVDLEKGSVALFGIPRNTGSLPLSDEAAAALGTDVYPEMISNLYEAAQDHPELAPEGGDPGAVVLRDTASRLLGIPIHHYAVVDMGGFVDLVDAFGGIKINVKERVWVRLSPPTKDEDYRVYDIKPGIQELDGHEALAFARSRTGNSDYDRMRRQRCVIMALLYQNGVKDLVLNFPEVIKVFQERMKTDIPIDRLQDLVRVRSKVQTDKMVSVGFGPPDYIRGRNELNYNILDTELVRATVLEYINEPEKILEQQKAAAEETGGTDCWKVD